MFLLPIPDDILFGSRIKTATQVGPYMKTVTIFFCSRFDRHHMSCTLLYIICSGSFVFIGKGTPIPFTPTKELIVTGLYRFVRNPLYISGVLVLAGEAILFQSLGILIYCLVMFGIFNVHVLMEETLLADKFGEAYQRYCKSVTRWIPSAKPYIDNDSESQQTGE